MPRQPDSGALKRAIISVLNELLSFIAVIHTKTDREIEFKEILLLSKLRHYQKSLKLTNQDRAEVQNLYFGIDWKVSAKIREKFPNLDKMLKERILH